MSVYLTPARVAECLGVNCSKVVAWINAGELKAANVARNRHGQPRWRIAQSDLDDFLLRRTSQPPAPMTKQSRRRKLPAVPEYVH